jgi:hypothetical protein
MQQFLIRAQPNPRYLYTTSNVFVAGAEFWEGRIGGRFANASWQRGEYVSGVWVPDGSSTFGSGFPSVRLYRIESAKLLLSVSPSATQSQIDALAAGFAALQLRLTSQVLASAADWESTITDPISATPVFNGIDITRAYRLKWAAINWGTVEGVEFRTADIGIGRFPFGGVTLELHVVVDGPELAEAQIGNATQSFTRIVRASTGRAAVSSKPKSLTRYSTSGLPTFGSATQSGLIYQTRGLVTIGQATEIQVFWRTNGQLRFGAATTDRNRYVTPLRLKAGKVTQDVGYMWVPVYLQLPVDAHVADWPWEFYYPDGTKIPHLIRNRVGHQVRALVYMRPSVTQSQDFFCRVG